MTHPQALVRLKMGLGMSNNEIVWSLGHAPNSQHQKGQRGVLRLRDQIRKRDKLFSYSVLHPKPTNKLVRTHFAPFWCWDKPRATLDSLDSPRPGLGGSHHLPPYSILCSSVRRLHPNDTFSRDSQGGVPKLSWFGLPGLWASITSCSDLGLG